MGIVMQSTVQQPATTLSAPAAQSVGTQVYNGISPTSPQTAYANQLANANGQPMQGGSPMPGAALPGAGQPGATPLPGAAPQASPTPGNIPGLPPFKSIEKALLPLSGKQIHDFRGKVRKTQDGGNEPIVPKNGVTQVITINPDSGDTPTIHMAAGYACSITVVDGAGQPWPIVSATVGNGSRFKVQALSKIQAEPTIVVSDLLPHAQSNMLLTLQGMNTPIPVQMVSGGSIEHGRETVAYRVILRVRGMVPNSLPATFSPSPNRGTTAGLLQALYGTMPSSAKSVRIKNQPVDSYTKAWLLNGNLWVRTHARLLAPAWIATEQSADGVHAYVLPQTHALLLRFESSNHTVEVK